jgi:hypothetical protein
MTRILRSCSAASTVARAAALDYGTMLFSRLREFNAGVAPGRWPPKIGRDADLSILNRLG